MTAFTLPPLPYAYDALAPYITEAAKGPLLLGVGAVLASLIGTTGASMLLVRPLLRANAVRKRKTHIVVFFIFNDICKFIFIIIFFLLMTILG